MTHGSERLKNVAFTCNFVKFILHLQQQPGAVRTSDEAVERRNTIMKRDLLLPRRFRTVGWVILTPTLLLGIYLIFNGMATSDLAEGIARAVESRRAAPTVATLRQIGNGIEPWLNNLLIIGIIAGSLMITCSRERFEDEMIRHIRLNALLVALYVNFAVVIVAALFVYGLDFVDVLVYNLFTLPLLFLAVFRWRLWRLRKTLGDEE